MLLPGLLAAAGGVSWACGPAAWIDLSAFSGPPGREVVITGSGHPTGRVEARWDSATGPVLANAYASADGAFSIPFTIPAGAAPGTHVVLVRIFDSQDTLLYSTPGSLSVTAPPQLTLEPRASPPAGAVQVQGSLFSDGPVQLRWDSEAGQVLASTAGPDFSLPVTVPSGVSGRHSIVATGRDSAGRFFGRASAALDVTSRGYPVPQPPAAAARDTVGPAVAAAALSRANRNRTVSRKGYVTLFCGRFAEPGVAGKCGARSARSSNARRAMLTLPTRSFTAATQRPVHLRFRLSRKGMAALKRARKVGMRGHVTSHDRAGNESRATFRFTLKAPTAQRRARSSAAGPSW